MEIKKIRHLFFLMVALPILVSCDSNNGYYDSYDRIYNADSTQYMTLGLEINGESAKVSVYNYSALDDSITSEIIGYCGSLIRNEGQLSMSIVFDDNGKEVTE